VHPTQAGIFFASLVAFFFLQATTTATQTVGTATGAVDGTATDDTGAVLPGVTITISSPALMGTRTASTDPEGFYRFPALPPGEYTLAFAFEGFRNVRREGVRVGVGFTATVDVVLELAALEESVVVERQSYVVDKQSTAIATRFDASQLANLPGGRSMSSILAAAPEVYLNRFDVGGNAATLGVNTSAFGTSGANRPMVEGIDTTGVQGTGFTFDYGSFDEVSVYTAAHTAEWPKPGVQMQFIAKSGGNQYRGTLYADYENRAWQSFNIDEDQSTRGAQGGGGLSPRDANRLWSYHDVNADIGGYIKKDALWWYSSVRDQDMGARQINFPVEPHRTRVTNYSGKGTYQVTQNNRFVAYGQAGRNHQPNRLDPSGLTGLSATTAINESESTTEQLAWGWVWKGDWNSVIHDKAFLEIRAGQFGANRHEKPNGSSPRFEDVDTLRVRGGHRDFQMNLRREQVFGSVSHFKDGWFGNHHFKGGGEIYRTTQADIWRTGYRGDVLHVVRNEAPQEVYLFQTPSISEAGVWSYAAYASDSWRLNNRVTLNLGLRMDRYRIFLPEQEHPVGRFNPTAQTFAAVDNVIDWNVPTPRIAFITDLAGDGRTVLKFSYGVYGPNPGVETGFNANPNSSQWWRRHAWSDLDGSGVWEPGEEGRPLGRRGGVAMESLDPALDLPFVREVAGWIERELPAAVGVRTGIVWRGERQHFQRQNAYQPFEAFAVPVEIGDPGPDGQVATADDGPRIPGRELRPELVGLSDNIVRNVPNSDSHYWTWDIAANKRFSGRWSLVAGFAHTWSRDQASGYSGQLVRQNPYPLAPNDLINAGAEGRYEFRIWTAKVHGTYQAPWDLRITPLLRHQSGQPFGRTFTTSLNYGNNVRVLAEPIGTRRMDNITILDARVEKGFGLSRGRRVAAFIDVFNSFNANPEQNTNWSSGPSFLQPLNIVAPRIARVGAKLEW
jgi:Carboxypeptidase regulatory-like domain/TonB dependent receptor-like, beta-barrel